MTRHPWFLALAALACLAQAAHADTEQVVVLGFELKEVQTYDQEGNPLSKAPASAFAFPISSTKSGVGKSVGLPYQGSTVYVRRLQLNLKLPCVRVANKPSRSTVVAGERASMGEGQNCLLTTD